MIIYVDRKIAEAEEGRVTGTFPPPGSLRGGVTGLQGGG